RAAYVEPNQSVDPTKDKRLEGGFYAIMPSPVDGSIWGTTFAMRGTIVRLDPGSTPPATALAEVYNVPAPGFAPRGADIDSKGVVWVSLGSGHLGSFDRRKCKGPLNGPEAIGDQCPEGWTFYQYPGPGFGVQIVVPGEQQGVNRDDRQGRGHQGQIDAQIHLNRGCAIDTHRRVQMVSGSRK